MGIQTLKLGKYIYNLEIKQHSGHFLYIFCYNL